MDLFLAPESWPFTVAALLLVAIAVVEGLALLVGMSLSGWLDHFVPDVAHGVEGASDSWLGWLHVGKVPILVLLVILLTAFALIGYVLNALVHGTFGFYPPAPVSAVAAFLGALPVVRMSGATIARIIPRDETTAVSFDSLVGRVAVVVNGTARVNYPAEARVKNEHGQTLYVRVEPDDADLQFGAGESVLLVRQISGSRFLAIPNPRPDLL
ncbi:MAG: YqiJ family protein [Candidatus Contendobacter sp.]|nr:YqiJ family protein [Candidatus Contendobacter sp.]MDG4558322.1 YqiJ family protein [Candidatus Contendobacter sp.]